MGLYPNPKRYRYKFTKPPSVFNSTVQRYATIKDLHPNIEQDTERNRSHETNNQHLAYLYSLTTPANDRTTHFGSDHE
jgi:hypothetical protein